MQSEAERWKWIEANQEHINIQVRIRLSRLCYDDQQEVLSNARLRFVKATAEIESPKPFFERILVNSLIDFLRRASTRNNSLFPLDETNNLSSVDDEIQVINILLSMKESVTKQELKGIVKYLNQEMNGEQFSNADRVKRWRFFKDLARRLKKDGTEIL